MYELTRCYRQSLPALRFIGRCYHQEDRGADGGFGAQWDAAWKNSDFAKIEQAAGGAEKIKALCEDGDATIGLMRWATPERGEAFEYWVGMLTPPGTPVPEGMGHVDFAPFDVGVTWIHGDESDLFCHEDECTRLCLQKGMRLKPIDEQDNSWYCLERYACPRFTTPDEKGQLTLDICIPVWEEK